MLHQPNNHIAPPPPPPPPPSSPKFALGRTVATPGALDLLNFADLQRLMRRHHTGDWGDLDAGDVAANDRALKTGERLLSAYRLPSGEKVWIITEWDRSATTVLLPEEY